METDQWLLIVLLAFGAYSIRFAGLIIGETLNRNVQLKTALGELSGCLIVALVAATMANANVTTWIAAIVALAVALLMNNVVLTMILGFGALLILERLQTLG